MVLEPDTPPSKGRPSINFSNQQQLNAAVSIKLQDDDFGKRRPRSAAAFRGTLHRVGVV
jgi:hypothetical protein